MRFFFVDRQAMHKTLPWLCAVLFLAALPHALYQPWWLSVFVVLVLAGMGWRWKAGYPLAPWPVKTLLGGLVAVLIWREYGSFLRYEAATALLLAAVILKLTEIKARRDALVALSMAFLLLFCYALYAQDLFAAGWFLLVPIAIVAALLQLFDAPDAPAREIWREAFKLWGAALPVMAALLLFLPRIEGPIWRVAEERMVARTGLSDILSFDAISQLANNDEIAFRARFFGEPPKPEQMYWRAVVLSMFDGQVWRSGYTPWRTPRLTDLAGPVVYELTIEPTNRRWLFALDMPDSPPEGIEARLRGDGTWSARNPLIGRTQIKGAAWLSWKMDVDLPPMVHRVNRQLPFGEAGKLNPRTRAWAAELRRETPDVQTFVELVLDNFRQGGFRYTLSPPALGANAFDDFLFSTKRGFCEHYAASFVYVMRAGGVPARIVTGYLGGEENPEDGYWVVRQSDAHAWAEIWLAGQGWKRIDPTAVLPPAQIDANLAASNRYELSWRYRLQRHWESLENRWNQWVLSYNAQNQTMLSDYLSQTSGLDKLWPNLPEWGKLAIWLIVGTLLALSWAAWRWLKKDRPKKDEAWRRWQKIRARLRREGIACPPWETPRQLAKRLLRDAPRLAARFAPALLAISRTRYEQRSG
ncbi:MAG: DUF3488 and transglutaminase-like domain-containing protein [Zoogloeaceae bacterium]|nr:DUF3488 and transglutaminase-like domain-containing protein [Zoogloeaceae bacterium]